MISPIKQLARNIDLKKHKSPAPTGVMKLDDVRTAVIFLSGNDIETSHTVGYLRQLFDKLDIKLEIYALNFDKKQHIAEGGIEATFIHPNHINWYGRICRNQKTPEIKLDSDMFISLLGDPLYFVEREARCSSAMMKIGRHSKDVYNVVIEDAPGTVATQEEAFENIYEILKKIV